MDTLGEMFNDCMVIAIGNGKSTNDKGENDKGINDKGTNEDAV